MEQEPLWRQDAGTLLFLKKDQFFCASAPGTFVLCLDFYIKQVTSGGKPSFLKKHRLHL